MISGSVTSNNCCRFLGAPSHPPSCPEHLPAVIASRHHKIWYRHDFGNLLIWVCLKMVSTPLYLMVLLIIIPFLNGYFIGKINPTFSDKAICQNPSIADDPDPLAIAPDLWEAQNHQSRFLGQILIWICLEMGRIFPGGHEKT